jgi:hypothetical protein
MSGKAVISLTTGLEDPEKVTVAFLVAVAAAEQRRQTLMFLTKEAVRLASEGVAQGVACEGCPPLPDLAVKVVCAEDTDKILAFDWTTEEAEDTVLDIPLNIIREFTGPPPARSQAPKPGKFVVNISLGTLREQLQRATKAGE